MPTVLITGAARGLGLEFVRQYAAAGWRVHGCGRGEAPTEFSSLKGDVHFHALDVTDWEAVGELAHALKGDSIDVLLANAGVMGRNPDKPHEVEPRTWTQAMQVNALAPIKLAEAFLEHVGSSGQRKMVAISSRMGSLALAGGQDYTYRASKAALNAGWRNLAVDVRDRGIMCLLLHPGWVRTRMGGPDAQVSAEESVAGMMRIIAAMTPADSGAFMAFDGERIPW